MAYILKIGEAVISNDNEIVFISVQEQTHDGYIVSRVPEYGSNSIQPPYTFWGEFCKETQLDQIFFFDKTGHRKEKLLPFPVTDYHIEKINFSVERHKSIMNGINHPPFDWALLYMDYLLWLKYWFEWSLSNCKEPICIFEN